MPVAAIAISASIISAERYGETERDSRPITPPRPGIPPSIVMVVVVPVAIAITRAMPAPVIVPPSLLVVARLDKLDV
jgi:hypothetical protein